jgi:hypothetical protein
VKATPKRYHMVRAPGHALAGPSGLMLLHRKLLFERIGPGWHPCYWCGEPVEWRRGGLTVGALVADHVDHDKLNNDPANLVPSCNPCNAHRLRGESWDPWKPGAPIGRPDRLHARCRKGHLLTPDNVYIRPDTGRRRCLTCIKAAGQQKYEARTPEQREADLERGRQAIPCPVCGEMRGRTSMRRHIRAMHDQVPIRQQRHEAQLTSVLEAMQSISADSRKITVRLFREQIPGFASMEKVYGYRVLAEKVGITVRPYIRDGSPGATNCADLAERASIPVRRFTA